MRQKDQLDIESGNFRKSANSKTEVRISMKKKKDRLGNLFIRRNVNQRKINLQTSERNYKYEVFKNPNWMVKNM